MTKEEREERSREREKEGWILIGELECGERGPFPTGQSDIHPYFLYTKFELGEDNTPIYYYSITKAISNVWNFDYFIMTKRYSINTLLCMYISADRDHGRLNGGHLITRADGFKIRLAGYKDWIEVNDDFLNGRITLDELETKFRGEGEYLYIEDLKKNSYMQSKEDQEMLNNFKIIL